MAKKGIGRRTKQYNAGAKGARTLAEYAEAAATHTRGAHDAGGAVIHATPKAKRAAFASQIWATRRSRGTDGRKNPAETEAVYLKFHGDPSSEDVSLEVDRVEHGDLAALGELVELKVKPAAGGPMARLAEFDGALLACDSDMRQLYIVGGNQAVDLADLGVTAPHDLDVLGSLVGVVYFTTKSHLGEDGGTAEYHHTFGEEGGRVPQLVYDSLSESLAIVGGDYTITAEGIKD